MRLPDSSKEKVSVFFKKQLLDVGPNFDFFESKFQIILLIPFLLTTLQAILNNSAVPFTSLQGLQCFTNKGIVCDNLYALEDNNESFAVQVLEVSQQFKP